MLTLQPRKNWILTLGYNQIQQIKVQVFLTKYQDTVSCPLPHPNFSNQLLVLKPFSLLVKISKNIPDSHHVFPPLCRSCVLAFTVSHLKTCFACCTRSDTFPTSVGVRDGQNTRSEVYALHGYQCKCESDICALWCLFFEECLEVVNESCFVSTYLSGCK